MSLIDREKLIAEYDRVHVGEPGKARQLMLDAPAVEPEQKWIPCSERSPETQTAYYLVTVGNFGRFFTTTLPDEVDIVRWDYDRRKGRNSWHWCTERTVIAWMGLPKPYGGESGC